MQLRDLPRLDATTQSDCGGRGGSALAGSILPGLSLPRDFAVRALVV